MENDQNGCWSLLNMGSTFSPKWRYTKKNWQKWAFWVHNNRSFIWPRPRRPLIAVPSSPQSLSSDHLDSAGECLHGVPRPAQLPTGQQAVGGWEGQDCGWCCWVWLAGNGRHCVACAPWTAVRDRRSKRENWLKDFLSSLGTGFKPSQILPKQNTNQF